MYLPLAQQTSPRPKPQLSTILSLHNYVNKSREGTNQNEEEDHEDPSPEDQFSLSISSRNDQPRIRTIHRSMVNRSCINTCSYSCKNLVSIPQEIIESGTSKLAGIQKIDLSFNNIQDISSIKFEGLTSLKQLIVNDNHIVEIPHHKLNNCRQLTLANFTNNHLALIPPVTRISFLMAKGNPIKLITSQLVQLSNVEFITFDWMIYLIDPISYDFGAEPFKQYVREYSEFKLQILSKVDYTREDNLNYCDFNCFFNVRLEESKKKDSVNQLLANLTAKAILRSDTYFIGYLRNFHNQVNYAGLSYNSRLLLQLALQCNKNEIIELFKLRKVNYSQIVSDATYFESVKLCCKYCNYDLFKYLIHIRSRKYILQKQDNLSAAFKETIDKYNKEKNSDKILMELLKFWVETCKDKKVPVKLPVQFSNRQFKSISTALLDIYLTKGMCSHFSVESEKAKTTPLHFAMKSRNEQLLRYLLQAGENVFEKNCNGFSCKYIQGSTQISRKMVWKREKKLIKNMWKSVSPQEQIIESRISLPSSSRSSNRNNFNSNVQSRIGYEQIQPSYLLYFRPLQEDPPNKSVTFSGIQKKKREEGALLDHLSSCIRGSANLTWKKDYLKKIVAIDVAIYILSQIQRWDEVDFLQRLNRWSKTVDSLLVVGNYLTDQNELLRYEIVQTIFKLTGSEVSEVVRPLPGSNFWCCQNVVYE